MVVSSRLHEKTMMVDGISIHYCEMGPQTGRPIVFLHGGIGNARLNWSEVMSLLADEYHVIAPDLPGFGKSDPLPKYRLHSMLHWISSFLEKLELEQAVVVGNSFGGLLARLYAAAYPQHVPALILVNGGTTPGISPLARMVLRLPVISTILFRMMSRAATSERTLRRMIYVEDVLTPEFIRTARNSAANFQQLMQMTGRYPLPEKRRPPVLTLIVWGVEDQVIELAEGKRIKRAIQGAELVEISNCGHMPQLEAPDTLAWQIRNYLVAHRNDWHELIGVSRPA